MAKYQALDVALKTVGASLRAKALDAAKRATDAQVAVLNDAVKNWKRRPIFSTKVVARTGNTTYQIIAKGDADTLMIFNFVDLGTKAHRIPKLGNTTAKTLVFNTPYSAKTAPVARGNVGTGATGGKRNIRKFVQHPGTEARAFIAFAQLAIEDEFNQVMQENVKRVSKG